MQQIAKIGLLPLYVKLYDDIHPSNRPRIDGFADRIARQFEEKGLEVVSVSPCRLSSEVQAAVDRFETEHVDALVTLHLAYSPSLESEKVLSESKLPIVICDTTPSFSYGPTQDPGELMYNHGIHGVQDLCNMLNRRGKSFAIEAGHWEKSDVLDRVCEHARAARVANGFRGARVGLIGHPFDGMGDFAVPFDRLNETLGLSVVTLSPKQAKDLLGEVKPAAVESEVAEDTKLFEVEETLDHDTHARSNRVYLGLKQWIAAERLTGFSFNFLDIDEESGLQTVPFLAASKLMASGVGYAGEGDVLTAAFVGALMKAHPETSFTEMFCPDWEGQSIFLSHMGEFNPRTVEGRARLVKTDYRYSKTDPPAVCVGRFQGGEAHLVDLAPTRTGFSLICAPGEVLSIPGEDRMHKSVHGWIRPTLPIEAFLSEYSRIGGTHHLALVYGSSRRELESLSRFLSLEMHYLE